MTIKTTKAVRLRACGFVVLMVTHRRILCRFPDLSPSVGSVGRFEKDFQWGGRSITKTETTTADRRFVHRELDLVFVTDHNI